MNRIQKKSPPPQITDPVFGLLTFRNGLWITATELSQSGWFTSVDAPLSGPSETQRRLLQKIRANFEVLRGQSLDFIGTHAFASIDVATLSIYSTEIGTDAECADGKFTLEYADEQADLVHRVTFERGAPTVYGCDD